MSAPIFRDAVPNDGKTVTEFQIAMAAETEKLVLPASVCASGVSAVFADPARGRYFVSEWRGAVIASLMVTYEWSDWRNGSIWWLQSVYVRPAARGQGVFRGLYQHVRSIAEADPSVKGIRLYVDRRNSRAQIVYRQLGMDGDHYQVFEWMK